ncbi:MAG: SRPBCC family protein [Nocardioides sp.]
MVKVEGQITIARPVEEVFDYVADQTNEPQYNPAMVRADKIGVSPLGVGTRFSSAVHTAGRTVDMIIEVLSYDRPRLLASRTVMKQADIHYILRFEAVPAGTRMQWSGGVRPQGPLRLLTPVVGWIGRRQEQRIWSSMKQRLEGSPEKLASTDQ